MQKGKITPWTFQIRPIGPAVTDITFVQPIQEKEMSLNCLDKNVINGKEECKDFIENYKLCKRFWVIKPPNMDF